MPEKWWEAFGDKELNALVESVMEQNLPLQAAWARLEQAHALAKQAAADSLPRVDASAGVQYYRNVLNAGPAIGRITVYDRIYSLGAAASYEVDLWGRVRAQKEAGRLAVVASREDVDALAVTLAATAGELWFSLAEAKAQQKLLEEQVATAKAFLELVDFRFRQGQATSLDVSQQRQQLSSIQAQQPLLAAAVEITEHQLAVLTGRPPRAPLAATLAHLPNPPPLPAAGLPADLLNRRPDVRALHARLTAADCQVAMAIANRLPALRLTAAGQYQGDKFTNVFRDLLWNVAGNLTAPVFEGGRLRAEVERNRAVLKELTLAYGQAVLDAFREVEDALTQERQQRAHIAGLEAELTDARSTLEQARTRYSNGVTDYTPVLLALQTVQGVERQRLRAQRDLLSYRVHLYRALGGAWLEAPPAKP